MTVMSSPWQALAFNSKVHDRYLRGHASQDIKRDVACVFVAVRPETTAICGCYSLSATSFQRDELLAEQARRLPRYPVPPVHAMVVDAKDAAAAKFYRKYGFIDFPNNTQRLFLPIATIRQLPEP